VSTRPLRLLTAALAHTRPLRLLTAALAHTRALRLLIAALACLVVLGGCGTSAPSNRQQIAALIRRESVRPQTLCSHLTASLLASLGGQAGCLREAARAAPDPSTRLTSLTVRGNRATAVVRDRAGVRTLTLVRARGAWRVAGVS